MNGQKERRSEEEKKRPLSSSLLQSAQYLLSCLVRTAPMVGGAKDLRYSERAFFLVEETTDEPNAIVIRLPGELRGATASDPLLMGT